MSIINNDYNITMEVNEHFRLEDGIDLANKMNKPWLRGHVVFRDPVTGKVLLEKDNLILLRSRAYVLELISGLRVSANTDYNVNNYNRTIQLFKIGSGGADVTSSPMEVVAPKFNNTELYQSIPFKIEDPNTNVDVQKKANPSYVLSFTDEQKKTYYLDEESPDGSVSYYGKVFEKNSPRLVVNTTTNVCYFTCNLNITKEEARGQYLNELGLVLANYNSKTNKYENAELFSHITFETISLKSLKRGVIISYNIYA